MPVRRGMRMRSTSRIPTTIVISPTSGTLASGSPTLQLSAIVKDQTGATMAGTEPDAWHSANTAVATVSTTGLVTFVAAGGPMNVTASLTTAGGTITSNACAVTGSSATFGTPDIFMFDFETMTASGPTTFTGSPNGQTMTDAFGDPNITVIADPTPRATGHVAKYIYSGDGSGSSDDKFLGFYGVPTQAYGAHLWTRGKLFIQSAASPWTSADNRKLIRINNSFGAGLNGQDVVLHRVDANNLRYVSQQFVNGAQGPGGDITGYSGSDIANDTWTTIEVHLRMSASKDAQDGLFEVYMDGAPSPTFSITSAMDFATVGVTTNAGSPIFVWGDQLTVPFGHTGYTDIRYWDDLAISTTRIGP